MNLVTLSFRLVVLAAKCVNKWKTQKPVGKLSLLTSLTPIYNIICRKCLYTQCMRAMVEAAATSCCVYSIHFFIDYFAINCDNSEQQTVVYRLPNIFATHLTRRSDITQPILWFFSCVKVLNRNASKFPSLVDSKISSGIQSGLYDHEQFIIHIYFICLITLWAVSYKISHERKASHHDTATLQVRVVTAFFFKATIAKEKSNKIGSQSTL